MIRGTHFPALCVGYVHFVRVLIGSRIIYVLCHWLKILLWISFYDTQLKVYVKCKSNASQMYGKRVTNVGECVPDICRMYVECVANVCQIYVKWISNVW